MKHILFVDEPQDSYEVAILIKPSYFNYADLKRYYVDALEEKGIHPSKVIAFDLHYPGQKCSPTQAKNYLLDELLPTLRECGIKYIYCADATYFKAFTKLAAMSNIGYIHPCTFAGYEHMKITAGFNHGALIHNPEQYDKIDLSIQTLADEYSGVYTALGASIIQYEDYPSNEDGVTWSLNRLLQQPLVVCDIETFSLSIKDAGLGSIAFAWSKHEGLAFPVDYVAHSEGQMSDGTYGFKRHNPEYRKLLRRFFESYKGTLIFHNATFDTKVLIHELWMQDPLDRQGMLHGLHTIYRAIHDTKIIAYLATNTTAGNSLGLKDLGHEYAGNWAQSDINDIRKIQLDNLLRYNLVDCLTTFYVFEKYFPKMVADKQEDLYKSLMLPTLKVLTQIELIGMPMEAAKVKEAKAELLGEVKACMDVLNNSTAVREATKLIRMSEVRKYNESHKKQKIIDDFNHIEFNPGSGQQLAVLLHEVMHLPILERTKTKQPATGGDILEKLINHTKNPEYIEVLNALIDLSKADKVITAFIPAFEAAVPKADGRSYLHGSFNLGGTISGRLSSSKPNLQNLPSGSKWGKLVKKCFSAATGWLFVGADFASLEDRINTLLTKDSNKVKVYTDGYDGHCLRAFYYFGEQMPDVVSAFNAETIPSKQVEIVNSIKKLYPTFRQDSKAPTFALTYAGTWTTLVKNCGFSEQVAKQIERNYHEMYKESDSWMVERLKECCEKGYATVAFGLRIRTPLLKQTVLGTAKTPREAEAEARSVGNAIGGQSYGLLNNRAAVEFMNRVWASPYRYDILPVALIHDAIYLVIRDNLDVVTWANNNLTECMAWNELPEIQHPEIKLSAELDIFYPNWSSAITLPNNTTKEEVSRICKAWYAENMKQVA